MFKYLRVLTKFIPVIIFYIIIIIIIIITIFFPFLAY